MPPRGLSLMPHACQALPTKHTWPSPNLFVALSFPCPLTLYCHAAHTNSPVPTETALLWPVSHGDLDCLCITGATEFSNSMVFEVWLNELRPGPGELGWPPTGRGKVGKAVSAPSYGL